MMNGHEQVPLVKFIERPKCHKMLLNEVQCFPISNFQEFPSAGSIFMRKFFLSSHFSHQVSFIHRKPSHIRRGPFVTSRCLSDLSFTYGLANYFIDDDDVKPLDTPNQIVIFLDATIHINHWQELTQGYFYRTL